MIYYIRHWYKDESSIPVPEAQIFEFSDGEGGTSKSWGIDTEDLNEFAEMHGPIQIHPPTKQWPNWSIFVTDKTGKFSQK